MVNVSLLEVHSRNMITQYREFLAKACPWTISSQLTTRKQDGEIMYGGMLLFRCASIHDVPSR